MAWKRKEETKGTGDFPGYIQRADEKQCRKDALTAAYGWRGRNLSQQH